MSPLFILLYVKNNLKFYPCWIYCISKSVNQFEEFRLSLDENEKLICYDIIHPYLYNFS
ncbi:hypothetical protein IY972_04425 [Campylobacter volucris]|uniref:CatA-like O-acetyltransferase n=1 Tax=Campylobacter volucris TaxID=1031542 RepID=UPI0018A004AC|nr:hypothetical protein [Campylobacter volucris]MBF7060155.1 hypothetical protein [Campylobacter volucris]